MKIARLSALHNVSLYPQEITLVLISVKRLSEALGHSVSGRIKSMKNSNDHIRNRTDLPACSAVPQPTAYPTKKICRTVISLFYVDLDLNLGLSHRGCWRIDC
jgi:hypothetical protein